jgi:hypothetical protein
MSAVSLSAETTRFDERTERNSVIRELQNSLLVGPAFQNAATVIGWLRSRRCGSIVVSTFREACESIETGQYDIVLSKNQLPDGSGIELIECLAGLPITLFISLPVENNCIWLPAILCGVHCWGTGALRPKAFARLLDEVIVANHLEVLKKNPRP